MKNQDMRLPLAIFRLVRLLLFGLIICAAAGWMIKRSTAQKGSQHNPYSATGFNNWTTHGPQGSPGIFGLAIDPNDPSIVYSASRSKVFKSTDGGASWNAGTGPGVADPN